MPEQKDIDRWKETIFERYENYLKTSFYFAVSSVKCNSSDR